MALGKYMSKETLNIVDTNTIQCRGGRNASVSVDDVQVSSNESWSDPIRIYAGMVVSFSTNFENKQRRFDNVDLSFQAVFLSPISRTYGDAAVQTRRKINGNKRPRKKHDASQQPKKAAKAAPLCHQALASVPIPSSTSCPPETQVNKGCLPQQPQSYSDPGEGLTLTSQAEGMRSVSPSNVDNAKLQPSPHDGGDDTSCPGQRLNEYHDKQIASIANNEQIVNDALVADPTSPIARPLCDECPFRLFFCPLGQDMSKGLIQTLSNRVRELGAIVVDSLGACSHLIVSPSVSSWEKVSKRLGMEEKELQTILISVSLLSGEEYMVAMIR